MIHNYQAMAGAENRPVIILNYTVIILNYTTALVARSSIIFDIISFMSFTPNCLNVAFHIIQLVFDNVNLSLKVSMPIDLSRPNAVNLSRSLDSFEDPCIGSYRQPDKVPVQNKICSSHE